MSVKWLIQFKLASLTYKLLLTGTPSYLSERLHAYVLSLTLRSSPLTCTSLALIFISIHARFILQLPSTNSLEFSPYYSLFVSDLKHLPKTS